MSTRETKASPLAYAVIMAGGHGERFLPLSTSIIRR